MTPEAFQTVAVGWMTTAAAVTTAAIVTIAALLPKIAALESQVKSLFDLHNQNATAINNVAIATPTPTPLPPVGKIEQPATASDIQKT